MINQCSTFMLNLPCYSKYDSLYEIFEERGLFLNWPSKKISAKVFLEVISRSEYNLKADLNICASTVSRISSEAFPDKPRTNVRICTFLLNCNGYRWCARCETVLPLDSFHNNASKSDGKNSYCRLCFNDSVRDYRRYYQALHKAAKLKRTPKWADLEQIQAFYKKCPEGCHVDHIIPLLGASVSGLHVLENLQYLTAQENISKSNSYIAG